MSEQYNGWAIRVFEGNDSFGDLAGYDEAASIERFCEILTGLLVKRFPGAEIDVEQVNSTLRPVVVYGADPDDDTGEQDAIEQVNAIREGLFTERLGKWAVEPAPAQ